MMKTKLFILITAVMIFLITGAVADTVPDNQKVTVEYSFSSETAQIGQPLKVQYEIKGGSGKYKDIRWAKCEITEHCAINDVGGDLTKSKGSFTVIPECGDFIQVSVSCIDKETDIIWSENYSKEIKCIPNPNIPITIDKLPEKITQNTPFSFRYSIDSKNSIGEARVEIWAFVRNDTYPDIVLEKEIQSKKDTVEFTPKAGKQLYIAIRGKDTEGNPFYAKTDRLQIEEKEGEHYDDVTVDYSFSPEEPQIGQPLKVNYEIKGGSGKYEDIHWGMMEITEHCCINDRGGELTKAKGSFTVIPECGEFLQASVSCIDKETGINWCENYSKQIQCAANPDISVKIRKLPATIMLNRLFSFQYQIGGNNKIAEAKVEIWSFARNDTYPDCVFEKAISSKKDTVTYIPKVGNQLYIAVRGKDAKGNPFYVKTDRLSVTEGQAMDISDAKLSKIKDQTYTGKKLAPKVTVKYDGKKLSEGTDYEVSYKNNKSIGTATVTISGLGEYEGSAETTFSILPEAVKLTSLEAGKKKITVEWEKGKKITGYEIEYSRKKNYKDSESLTVTKAKTTKITIKDLKKGKTYYVRIRTYKETDGKKYYSKWSDTLKVKVK